MDLPWIHHGFTMDSPWICHGFTHPPSYCACNVWIARFLVLFQWDNMQNTTTTVLGSGTLTSGEDFKGKGRLGTWRPDPTPSLDFHQQEQTVKSVFMTFQTTFKSVFHILQAYNYHNISWYIIIYHINIISYKLQFISIYNEQRSVSHGKPPGNWFCWSSYHWGLTSMAGPQRSWLWRGIRWKVTQRWRKGD